MHSRLSSSLTQVEKSVFHCHICCLQAQHALLAVPWPGSVLALPKCRTVLGADRRVCLALVNNACSSGITLPSSHSCSNACKVSCVLHQMQTSGMLALRMHCGKSCNGCVRSGMCAAWHTDLMLYAACDLTRAVHADSFPRAPCEDGGLQG